MRAIQLFISGRKERIKELKKKARLHPACSLPGKTQIITRAHRGCLISHRFYVFGSLLRISLLILRPLLPPEIVHVYEYIILAAAGALGSSFQQQGICTFASAVSAYCVL
jgi:hypothetical protein